MKCKKCGITVINPTIEKIRGYRGRIEEITLCPHCGERLTLIDALGRITEI